MSSSKEFHGIPWNFACANFADTSISMEFHGISMTWAVLWNSMEFRWHELFHGIPWNLECANFADTSSSMEFHRTRSAQISLKRAVPWNSIEFHGTWSAPITLTWEGPWNYMKLWVRQFRWHEQIHGIPWNLECAIFADMSSSMEFYGIPWI